MSCSADLQFEMRESTVDGLVVPSTTRIEQFDNY